MRPSVIRSRAVLLAAVALAGAACGGGEGTPAPLVIVPTRIAFATQPDSAIVGDSVALGATLTDASGRAGTVGTLTYASSDTTVARVSAAGVVRFVGAGPVVVTARATDVPGTTPLTLATPSLVSLAPAATVRVLPTRVDASPGEQVALSVAVYDASGNRISYPVAYASDNTGIASVSGNALTAGTAGGTQIAVRATFRGRGVSTTLPVAVAPVTQGAFIINLVQVGAVDPRYAAEFTRAAAFWQSVITAALPAADLALPAGSCADSTPEVKLAASTGVTILFRVDSIDGKGAILGAAGPCVLRSDPVTQGRGLTLVGSMRFDSADFAGLVAAGTAYDVIRHEMGHVLGIGTLWNVGGVRGYLVNEGTLDPQYTGPLGEGGSAALGFTQDRAGVPVENTGGPGTAGSHWRSAVFRSELMVGYLAKATTHPASRLTVLSLADLGYAVNVAASEPLLPPSAADLAAVLGPVAERTPVDAFTDVALPPIFRVVRNGTVQRLVGTTQPVTARALR